MAPHQQRVVEERIELQKKIEALDTFVHGSFIRSLDIEEQQRLEKQLGIMKQLEEVLSERIAFFLEHAA